MGQKIYNIVSRVPPERQAEYNARMPPDVAALESAKDEALVRWKAENASKGLTVPQVAESIKDRKLFTQRWKEKTAEVLGWSQERLEAAYAARQEFDRQWRHLITMVSELDEAQTAVFNNKNDLSLLVGKTVSAVTFYNGLLRVSFMDNTMLVARECKEATGEVDITKLESRPDDDVR